MTTTTYYNLNIVEGTDIVNPLIVDNPNYEKIDETMHNNAVTGVTLATEIANATVHAITRENSECAVIRFIATSRWKAGDTVTVDGVPVTALLPSGETLPDGAYVINSNVLCVLTGTNLTIYAERKKVENANEIAFNDTTVAAELVRLDEKTSNLKWKLIGTIVGTGTSINLPTDTYDEFLIIMGTPVYKWSVHLTKNELNTFNAFFNSAVAPETNTVTQFVSVTISNDNRATLKQAWQNGSDNSSQGLLIVYAK